MSQQDRFGSQRSQFGNQRSHFGNQSRARSIADVR